MALPRIALLAAASTALAILGSACSRRMNNGKDTRRDEVSAARRAADPASCLRCHAAEYAAWNGSHHALAETALGSSDPAYPSEFPPPVRWIGVSPLKQLLIPAAAGRIQVADRAYDPAARTWFSVFGSEQRQPGEWGHWTGRGMNWNSQCAWCHNTDLAKNYHAATDTYATTVGHQGITCAACHGAESGPLTRTQAEAVCASCHARRGELTGKFHPGEVFDDHFTLLTVDDTDVYYPDGQVKEEDFEYAAFLGSKMHAAGVSCVDCHDPHSGHLRAEGNALCLTCHAGGNPRFRTAPVIHPEEHSHHAAASAGNLCVNCHMPSTVYMQRDSRRDHGFTIPDPLLTKETGEPNACNRCHTDKTTEWALAATAQWQRGEADRPTRQRARLIAAVRRGASQTADGRDVRAGLLAVLKSDPIGYWRAVAAGLCEFGGPDPAAQSALVAALKDPDPLTRAMAARTLGESLPAVPAGSSAEAALQAALADPARNVRIEAAWGLRDQIDPTGPAAKELAASLEFNRDQPVGAYRLGMYDLSRNDVPGASAEFEKATRWDPLSPQFHSALAVADSMGHRPADAAAQLAAACRLAPTDANLRYQLGLALNENGDLAGAADALAESVRLDPNQPRVWYNLGLARLRQNRRSDAVAALEEALQRDPGLEEARALLARLGPEQ